MIERRSGQTFLWLGLGLAAVVIAGLAAWQLTPSAFKGAASSEEAGEIPVPFEEFRTIMVRNSPTRTIIEHGGMQLVTEEVLDLQLDLSRDSRPLINALLRRSQSDITSRKRMVVAVNDEEIHAKDLELIQDALITPEVMEVATESTGPSGELTSYRTTLRAEPKGTSTMVHVTTAIEIEKQLSRLFHGTARSRLEASTKKAAQEQLVALQKFSVDNAKK